MTLRSPHPSHLPPSAVHTVHAYTPIGVVAAALLFHAMRHPVPLATLALLMTAAYGRNVWREALQHRRFSARLGHRTLSERAEVTETVTHQVRERNVRDTVLAIQPTTR